jgi:hypothetical protein
MSDVLNDLNVVVPPAYSCSEFEVSSSVILECQDFVACGCPGIAPYDELEPLYFASLADHNALVALCAARLRAEPDYDDVEEAEAEDSASMAEHAH